MLTRPEKFVIGAVAGGVILAAGIVLLVAFLNGKLQFADKETTSEPVVEEVVEQAEAPQLPLPNPPLVTYTEGFPEGSPEDEEAWELINTGDELGEGFIVKTDQESLLDIRIRPGTIVRVAENTLFSLGTLGQKKIALNIDSGMLISRVKKLTGDESFLFQTESTVAGIRGTELAVSVSEGDTVFTACRAVLRSTALISRRRVCW